MHRPRRFAPTGLPTRANVQGDPPRPSQTAERGGIIALFRLRARMLPCIARKPHHMQIAMLAEQRHRDPVTRLHP